MTLIIQDSGLDGLALELVDGEGRVVATLWGFDGLDAEANARLFSVAKDLLAMLEDLQWAGRDRYDHSVCPECEESPGFGHGQHCAIAKLIAAARGDA
jgi:hypothetical protein